MKTKREPDIFRTNITLPGFREEVGLVLTGTIPELRRYAQEVKNKQGNPYEDDFSRALGCFLHTPFLRRGDLPGDFYGDHFGDLVFAREFITYETVAHECAHAAFEREWQISRFNMDYHYKRDEEMTHQERFCYYHGWLVTEVLQILAGEKVNIALKARYEGKELS